MAKQHNLINHHTAQDSLSSSAAPCCHSHSPPSLTPNGLHRHQWKAKQKSLCCNENAGMNVANSVALCIHCYYCELYWPSFTMFLFPHSPVIEVLLNMRLLYGANQCPKQTKLQKTWEHVLFIALYREFRASLELLGTVSTIPGRGCKLFGEKED